MIFPEWSKKPQNNKTLSGDNIVKSSDTGKSFLGQTLNKFKMGFGSTSNRALTPGQIIRDGSTKSVAVQNSMVENTLVSNTDFRGVSENPTGRQLKRRRRSYLPLSRVQKVFPELSPKDLVSLVELTC